MKLKIQGFEKPIELYSDRVNILEIHNRKLASRIFASLLSGLGEEALEPYILWEEEKELLQPGKVLFPIASLFDLPWQAPFIVKGQLEIVYKIIQEDYRMRDNLEQIINRLQRSYFEAALALNSDYCFKNDFDMIKYLKTFGFGVERFDTDTLFDSYRKFILMLADIGCNRALVAYGFKDYFDESELMELYNLHLSLKIPLLSLEHSPDNRIVNHEKKTVFDQGFLQY